MTITAPSQNKEEDIDKPFCCTHCGSEQYIKYGKKNGKQQYMCKECNRKFVDNQYFEHMKGNPKLICLTLDLYFKGISLRKISDHLKQFYEVDIAHTTLYNWITRYIAIIDNYVSQFQPQTGLTWHVDEMMVRIDGDWFYLWNVLDSETRFHLASVISRERKIKDARKVFQVAKQTSHGKKPRRIITDGLGSYHKAINKEFHTTKKETLHFGNVGIRGKQFRNLRFDNNLVERLHGTVRDRNKVQRGLEIEESPFIKGHQLYYNFVRPHNSLNGKTPSEEAGITIDGDKKWLVLLNNAIRHKLGY